jgi:predicted nucleic acid-binding protein
MDRVVDTNVLVAGLRSQQGASNALLHKIRGGKVLVLHLSKGADLEYEEAFV